MSKSAFSIARTRFVVARVLGLTALTLGVLLGVLTHVTHAAAAAPIAAHGVVDARQSLAGSDGFIEAGFKKHHTYGHGFKYKRRHGITEFGVRKHHVPYAGHGHGAFGYKHGYGHKPYHGHRYGHGYKRGHGFKKGFVFKFH